MFVNRKGGWLSKSTFYRPSFVPVRARAGVPPVRFNDLRHTSATLLLVAGAGIKVVSERLGHESIDVTLKFYVHVLPSHQGQAVALLDGLLVSPTAVPPNPGKKLSSNEQASQG